MDLTVEMLRGVGFSDSALREYRRRFQSGIEIRQKASVASVLAFYGYVRSVCPDESIHRVVDPYLSSVEKAHIAKRYFSATPLCAELEGTAAFLEVMAGRHR